MTRIFAVSWWGPANRQGRSISEKTAAPRKRGFRWKYWRCFDFDRSGLIVAIQRHGAQVGDFFGSRMTHVLSRQAVANWPCAQVEGNLSAATLALERGQELRLTASLVCWCQPGCERADGRKWQPPWGHMYMCKSRAERAESGRGFWLLCADSQQLAAPRQAVRGHVRPALRRAARNSALQRCRADDLAPARRAPAATIRAA